MHCRYAEDVGVSMATGEEEAPPTSFPEAETLRLLSSLVSWEEDKARSVRVKVSHHYFTIVPNEFIAV